MEKLTGYDIRVLYSKVDEIVEWINNQENRKNRPPISIFSADGTESEKVTDEMFQEWIGEDQKELWYEVHRTILICRRGKKKVSIPTLMKKFNISRK